MAFPARFGIREGVCYGLLGLPLAFVALPLYVILPHHYASVFGVPLATLGAVLLGARLFDAFIDPLLGQLADRLFARSLRSVLALGGVAAVLLALGFAGLFYPPTRDPSRLLVCATVLLMLTYAGYSMLSVLHQAWGAQLGGNESQRGRVVAWREGLGLVGVVVASVLPVALGMAATVATFWVALAAGWLAWRGAVGPEIRPASLVGPAINDVWQPMANLQFRRLLAVFVLNGIASAVPATLVLFFVQDRLQAPRGMEPAFLASYFLCAALSIPLWLRLVGRLGLARSWLCGMLLAIAAFIWTMRLGAGDGLPFLIVCAVSGIALGSDLALPGALLAGIVAQPGVARLPSKTTSGAPRSDAINQAADAAPAGAAGVYFGWWNFATKLNLAVAAGLTLPLLGWFGYAPGTRDAQGLLALSMAYGLLPCLLKALAAAALYLLLIRPDALARSTFTKLETSP